MEISVGDLLTLLELTNLNPFDEHNIEDTIYFVEIAQAIRKLEIDVAEVSYLVRHDEISKKIVAPKENIIARFLNKLRGELIKIENENTPQIDNMGKVIIDESGGYLASRLGLLDWPAGGVETVMSILMGHVILQQPCKLSKDPKLSIDGLNYDFDTSQLTREGILLKTDLENLEDKVNKLSLEPQDKKQLLKAIELLSEKQKAMIAPYLQEWPGRVTEVELKELPPGLKLSTGLTFSKKQAKLSWKGIFLEQNRLAIEDLKINVSNEFIEAIDKLLRKLKSVTADYRMLSNDEIDGIISNKSVGKRLDIVQKKFLPRLKRDLSLNTLVKAIDDEFDLGEDYAKLLLRKAFCNSKTIIGDAFLNPGFVTSAQDIAVEDPVFVDAWNAYLRVHKAAILVKQLGLKTAGIKWLVNSPNDQIDDCLLNRLPLVANQLAVTQQELFQEWWSLASFIHTTHEEPLVKRNVDAFFELLDKNTYDLNSDKGAFAKRLADLLDWNIADIESLMVDLNVTLPGNKVCFLSEEKGFLHPSGISRILNCLFLLKKIGADYSTAKKLTDTISSDTAVLCRNLVRAKYSAEAWAEIGKSIFDVLREKQRDALTEYLLEHNPDIYKDKNDLDEKLLIGTQMSACMETSRIVQAYIAVQRFINRCFLDREDEIVVNTGEDPGWNDWSWMQNYRVWDAHRQIAYLFPENWIDPQLRDDKSPFFKDLESELLQNETNNEIAEDAVRHYLEKLDEVSNLEVMAYYYDRETTGKGTNKDMLHVFARTRATPSIYYYRRRIGKARWTAWEKVELDIDGDFLIPVVWNRRLYLFWPIFTEMNAPAGTEGGEPSVFWNIQMAWSEYFRNKWSAKKTTKEKMQSSHGPDGKDRNSTKRLHLFRVKANNPSGELSIIWSAYNFGRLIPAAYQGVNDYFVQTVEIEKAGVFHFTGYGNRVYTDQTSSNQLRKITGLTYDANTLVENDDGVVFLPRQINIQCDGIVLKQSPGSVPYRWVIDLQNSDLTTWAPYFFDDDARCFFVEPVPEIRRTNIILNDGKLSNPDFKQIDQARSTCFGSAYPEIPLTISEIGTIWPSKHEVKPDVVGMNNPVDPKEIFPYLSAVGAKELMTTAGQMLPIERRSSISPTKQPFIVIYRRPEVFYADTVELKYQFQSFDLPLINNYIKQLANFGVKGFFKAELQKIPEKDFNNRYSPTAMIEKPYPEKTIDYGYLDSYSLYNWELFFHIPFQIAVKLSQKSVL